MVQEFYVVRCFKCQSFQVQQVKKVNRWSCKLCGEKQSLLKEFGRGSGADCRRHVQKLNAMRGAMMEEQEHHTWSLWEQVGETEEESVDQVSQSHVSRWSKYLDPPWKAEPEEEHVLTDKQQLHNNSMTDRKRKRSHTPDQCSNLNSVSSPGTSLNHSSPQKKKVNPHVRRTGPVSKWSPFLSSDFREEPSVAGVTNKSCCAVNRPHPVLHVSSMFESGADFSFDDFLTESRL